MLCLLIILFCMFQAVFSGAVVIQNIMQTGIDAMIQYLHHILPNGPLTDLFIDGVLAGVGSVVVFLPQILILFLFILVLEDSGYMARAAFLMDRLMAKVGLNGRAFIPMLSGYACAIPAIMATRTIENIKDRMVTIMITPLTTCSARLPVYTLIIAAFIPSKDIFGFLGLQGLVMFILYLAGILAALGMGFLFKRFIFQGRPPVMLMEMPIYRFPSLHTILVGLAERAKIFLTRAGTIILSVMILLWFLSSYPTPPPNWHEPAVAYSFAGRIGQFLEPIFAPIGFNWQIVVALIPGLAAREAAIAGLGTVYAVSGNEDTLTQGLTQTLHHQWGLATGLAMLAWYVFAPQCISTLAVTKRETNSWRWPIVMFCYMFGLAYLAAGLVFHLAQWILT
jgi:ferrous iron transport protein B